MGRITILEKVVIAFLLLVTGFFLGRVVEAIARGSF